MRGARARSTHGMTPAIVAAISTGKFDYVNLHYHYIGSYTASGSGPERNANLAAVQAAKRNDMGVFIISPYDRGGEKGRSLCSSSLSFPYCYSTSSLGSTLIVSFLLSAFAASCRDFVPPPTKICRPGGTFASHSIPDIVGTATGGRAHIITRRCPTARFRPCIFSCNTLGRG